MKKLFCITLVALSLGGCATLQKLQEIGTAVTVGVSNPVTRERLAVAEYGAGVVLVSLNEYADNCEAGRIPPFGSITCKDVYRKIRPYAIQLRTAVARIRVFVDNNQQVNAIKVYDEIVSLINAIKQEAFIAGVPIKGG